MQGEDFRNDLRPVVTPARLAGAGNAAARRLLSPEELAPLTCLNDGRSVLAMVQTGGLIALGVLLGLWGLSNWAPWHGLSGQVPEALRLADQPGAALCLLLMALTVLGVAQHGLFILAHEAAHYRLLSHRGLNDGLGRLIGMVSGISMCTYRVIHRLHHNHLYGPQDPDTAIHGGYPRGVVYLWKKLGQDLSGWNAWKTCAYFFGAPAISADNGPSTRTEHSALNDTAPSLRAAARADRWWMVGLQLLLPLGCLAAGGWPALVAYGLLWLLPLLTVLQPILRLRAICEHGAVDDVGSPLTAARSNRCSGSLVNRLGGALLFPHHVNFHLEHHLYPAVPHYHLPRLHRLLQQKGVFSGAAEVRDLSDTFGRIFAPRRSPSPRPTPRQTAHE